MYIVFEGLEGVGKSTISMLIKDILIKDKYNVVLTKEPGSTFIGNKIRKLILESENINPETEALLYAADRHDNMLNIVIPALNDNKIVISDRSIYSYFAYQSARGIKKEQLEIVSNCFMKYPKPDLIIYMDCDIKEMYHKNKNKDRIESEPIEFFYKVNEYFKKYLDVPTLIISSWSESIENTTKKIYQYLKQNVL